MSTITVTDPDTGQSRTATIPDGVTPSDADVDDIYRAAFGKEPPAISGTALPSVPTPPPAPTPPAPQILPIPPTQQPATKAPAAAVSGLATPAAASPQPNPTVSGAPYAPGPVMTPAEVQASIRTGAFWTDPGLLKQINASTASGAVPLFDRNAMGGGANPANTNDNSVSGVELTPDEAIKGTNAGALLVPSTEGGVPHYEVRFRDAASQGRFEAWQSGLGHSPLDWAAAQIDPVAANTPVFNPSDNPDQESQADHERDPNQTGFARGNKPALEQAANDFVSEAIPDAIPAAAGFVAGTGAAALAGLTGPAAPVLSPLAAAFAGSKAFEATRQGQDWLMHRLFPSATADWDTEHRRILREDPFASMSAGALANLPYQGVGPFTADTLPLRGIAGGIGLASEAMNEAQTGQVDPTRLGYSFIVPAFLAGEETPAGRTLSGAGENLGEVAGEGLGNFASAGVSTVAGAGRQLGKFVADQRFSNDVIGRGVDPAAMAREQIAQANADYLADPTNPPDRSTVHPQAQQEPAEAPVSVSGPSRGNVLDVAATQTAELPAATPESALASPSATTGGNVVAFTTSKGSEYTVDGQTTQRTKSLHAGHETTDVGLKPSSDITYYVAPEDAPKIGMQALASGKVAVAVRGDRLYPLDWNAQQNRWGITPSNQDGVPFTTTPDVGRAPVELWGNDGTGIYSGLHAGNKITSISTEPTTDSPPPVPLPPASVASDVTDATRGNSAPWQMTRADFETTGEDLLHGTATPFDSFDSDNLKDRYGNDIDPSSAKARRFYFTNDTATAKQLSNAAGRNFKQVDYGKWLDANESLLGDEDDQRPAFLAALNSQIDTGKTLAYVDTEPGSPIEGSLVKVTSAANIPLNELTEDGDIRLYPAGMFPRVVKTRVYGPTLDLTNPKTVPDDLWAALGQQKPAPSPYRTSEPALPFKPGSWNHEYSTALIEYAEQHGYGKVKVPDGYESGNSSTIGLKDFIGYGRDPHRDFVAGAVTRGESVPADVLKDYPDLQPGSASQTEAAIQPGVSGVQEAPASSLAVDPARFQYKSNPRKGSGSTGSIATDVPFSSRRAGILDTWVDPDTGTRYVVNGHNRRAKALEDDDANVRFEDLPAQDANEARIMGALLNIGDGRGTATDAARLFRDAKLTPDQLKAEGVSMSGKIAADGQALSQLEPAIFHAVSVGAMSEARGAAIGRALPGDGPRQLGLVKLIERAERSGRSVTDASVSELARLSGSSPVVEHGKGGGLFDDLEPVHESLALDVADLSAWARKEIGADAAALKAGSNADRAARLNARGNVVNADRNATAAKEAVQTVEVYDRLSSMSGPVRDALNTAALDVRGGKNAAEVKRQLLDNIRDAVQAAASGQGKRGSGGSQATAAGTAESGFDFAGNENEAGSSRFGAVRAEDSGVVGSHVRKLGDTSELKPGDSLHLPSQGDVTVRSTDPDGVIVTQANGRDRRIPSNALALLAAKPGEESLTASEFASKRLPELFDYSTGQKGRPNLEMPIRPVTADEADRIADATGLNVSGYSHMVESSFIRHAMDRHGSERVREEGQIPLTRDDFAKLPSVLDSPDRIENAGKNSVGNDLIRLIKRVNGHVIVVEEVRGKRQNLSPITMYAYKAGAGGVGEGPGVPTPRAIVEETPGGAATTDFAKNVRNASGFAGPNPEPIIPQSRYVDNPDDPFAADYPEKPVGDTVQAGPKRAFGPGYTGPTARIKPDPLLWDGKPLARNRDVIADLGKAVGRRIEAGVKFERGMGGGYWGGSSRTAIRYAGDLDTAAHEIGHALDDAYGIVGAWAKSNTPSPFDNELIPQFSMHGSVAPAGRRSALGYQRTEGVAEWIRAYLVNPDAAAKAAPQFAAHFDATVPADVRARLEPFSTAVRRYAGAPPTEQALANVRMEARPEDQPGVLGTFKRVQKEFQPPTEEFGINIRDRAQAAVQDSLKPFTKAVDYVRQVQGVGKLLPANDPMVLARLLAGVNGKVNAIFEHGMVDSQNRPVPGIDGGVHWLLGSLDNTSSASLEGDMRDATALMVAERTLEKGPQRKNLERVSGIGAGITSDTDVAAGVIRQLKADPQRYSRLTEAASRYRTWANSLIDYMVDNGRMSQSDAAAIKSANQYYVSLHRIGTEMGVPSFGPSSGHGIGVASEPVQRLLSGTEEIDNPYKSLLTQTAAIVRETDRNSVMQAFRDLLVPTRTMHDGPVKNLAAVGALAKSGDERTIPIWTPDAATGEVKQEYWQFHPDVFGALKAYNEADTPNQLDKVARFVGATLIRNAVTHSPGFIVRNAIRDTVERPFKTEVGSTPLDTIKVALGQFTKPGRALMEADKQSFALGGGEAAGHYLHSVPGWHQAISEAVHELAHDPHTILSLPGDFVAGYKKFAEGSEMLNRMAEYRAAFNHAKTKLGYDDYNAQLFAASKARNTLDFAVAGTIGRQINKLVPFTNARIQGLTGLLVAARDNPALFAAKFGMLAASCAAVYGFHAAQGKDALDQYRNLPAYQRDLFWNFRITKDVWARIPKGFELAVLASGLERGLDRALGNKNAFNGYFKDPQGGGMAYAGGTLAQNLMPVDESLVAGPFKTLLEQAMNYDTFRQKQIVPTNETSEPVGQRPGERKASRLAQAVQKVLPWDARAFDQFLVSQGGDFGRTASLLSDVGRTDQGNKVGKYLNAGTGIFSGGPRPGVGGGGKLGSFGGFGKMGGGGLGSFNKKGF